MDTAPRRLTSSSGSSREASSEAEYTEAPASDTTVRVSFSSEWSRISSAASRSVSREAVPLPMLIRSTPCRRASERGKHRERPMRGNRLQPLAIVEVIAEIRAGLLLAGLDLRDQPPVLAQVLAQRTDQRCVLGESLHQDLARPLERRLGVGHPGVLALLGGEGGLQIAPLRSRDRAADRPAQRPPAHRDRPRAQSAPWCAAAVCRTDTGPRGAAWSRQPRDSRADRASTCPAPRCC